MKETLRKTLATAGLVVVLLAAAHVIVRPVHPDQEKPEKHPPGACVVCHLVSRSAEIVETTPTP